MCYTCTYQNVDYVTFQKGNCKSHIGKSHFGTKFHFLYTIDYLVTCTIWTTDFDLKGEIPGGFSPQKGGNPHYQPDKRWKPPKKVETP